MNRSTNYAYPSPGDLTKSYSKIEWFILFHARSARTFFWTTKTDSVTSGTFAKLKLVEQKSTNNVFGETLFRRLQILNTRFVSNKFWNGTAFDKTKTSVKGLNFVLRILTL